MRDSGRNIPPQLLQVIFCMNMGHDFVFTVVVFVIVVLLSYKLLLSCYFVVGLFLLWSLHVSVNVYLTILVATVHFRFRSN